MKEFSAETGGRYTYADDLENLQELALACSQIFNDCDDFILSGCVVSGSTINPGYVYLNGKLRYFSGATGITAWPKYICELNRHENVPYENGDTKVGRTNYSCELKSSTPVDVDSITGEVPRYITINPDGGKDLKQAFFGKYALLTHPDNGSQQVDKPVTFSGAVSASAGVNVPSGVNVVLGGTSVNAKLQYSNGEFSIYTHNSSGKNYKFTITDGDGFKFYVDNTLTAKIGATIYFYKDINANGGYFGGLALSGNNLYQHSSNALSSLYINSLSYQGGTTQYRNTYIGNGKGLQLFSVLGESGTVNINGVAVVTAGVLDNLTLKANMSRSNNALVNAMAWQDNSNAVMARIGYINTSDQQFVVRSYLGDIKIEAPSSVNIAPTIKENGVLLSEKYATKTYLSTQLSTKANSGSSYTKSESDNKYGVKENGLAQFIGTSHDAEACRNDIGAASALALNSYSLKSSYLADMAGGSEDKKRAIRNNIGAVGVDEAQVKLTDSGWILIKEGLYIRQYGKMVCIQGNALTTVAGTFFDIPNTIQPPAYDVLCSVALSNGQTWICEIKGGQRRCTVPYYTYDNIGIKTSITITYMIA